jgi:phospholipase/lecithinase/hemolysin
MRIISSLCAVFFSSVVAATSLSNIVVFGDSLSDTGNFYEFSEHQFPTSPPYFEGHFSNGPIWIERLMESYFPTMPALSPIENYAFGGAAVALKENEKQVSLQQEISHYLKDHYERAEANSLFVVWIGANNYLGKLNDADQTITDVNAGIVASLKRLVEKGAKHIMVINLPDLGKSPLAVDMHAEDVLSYTSAGHNKALAASVEQLQQDFSEVQWIYYDVNAAFTEIRANPAAHGFDNVNESCLSVAPNTDCNKFFFFDSVHPTTYTHKLLGEAAHLLLDQADIQFQ